jgi:hypothetical protein
MSPGAFWLAQDPPPPAQGPEFGHSSPIALVVTLVLLVALVFLIRSMNRHLRKLPKSFEPEEQPTPAGNSATTGPSAESGEPAKESRSGTSGGDPKT